MPEHEAARNEESAPEPLAKPLHALIPMTCTAVIERADGSRTADYTSYGDGSCGTLLMRLRVGEDATRRVVVQVSENLPAPPGGLALLVSFSTSPDVRDPRVAEYSSSHPGGRVEQLRLWLCRTRPVPRAVYVLVEAAATPEDPALLPVARSITGADEESSDAR